MICAQTVYNTVKLQLYGLVGRPEQSLDNGKYEY